MNKEKLNAALNYIDDRLICEAADYRPAPKQKRTKLWIFPAAAACCAVTVCAVGVSVYLRDRRNTHSWVSSDSVSTISSPLEQSSSNITDWNDFQSGSMVNSEVSSSNNTIDSIPSTPELTLEDWLNNVDVIWGEDELKGISNGEKIPLGTVKISDKLSELMQKDPEGIIAVMADFSPCINDEEMRNWEYREDTLAALISELDSYYYKTGKYYQVTETIVEPNGETHQETRTEEFITVRPEDEEKVSELRKRIAAVKSEYYRMKIDSIRETFSANGLDIYPIEEENGELAHYIQHSVVYCFATADQLENFTCGKNEAFVFYAAARLK